MDTNALKKFAQAARNLLMDQVTARLDLALAAGGAARREHPKAVQSLEAACATNRQQVIEQAAYAWFNRFTALRFMDATGLTNPGVVSPADGATRPEILAEALAGNLPDGARPEIAEYLNGTRPAHDPQAEAYRLLLIHACNHWHGPMPFMFERAEDYSELLMPDDLLSPDSILARLRAVMTEDACRDVEIIGWLYQFYISEKKDQVFAGLKKNVKITAENIPAATQLFTPHWIVRYLVENSLGRLWLLNRPQSKLAAQMDYYIAPEEAETDFLRVTRPEEIKVCDPACGSGHMLTYAFDLLYAIYEEEGYEAATIPDLILTHNLYGVEIDDRAGALAAFALVMKAAGRRRRFLRAPVQPNICVMQDVSFTAAELADYTAAVGRDLFTSDLRETCAQFAEAKNFGALIVPKLRAVAEVARRVAGLDFESNLFLRDVHLRVCHVLRMAEALSPKYHVVVANPPYMGGKGMNGKLADYAKTNFPDSKADLFAMFIERGFSLIPKLGHSAMVTMQSWMFLSSYEKLRIKIEEVSSVRSMAHLGNMVMGIAFGTAATIWTKGGSRNAKGAYCFVGYEDLDESNIPVAFPPRNERNGVEGAKGGLFWVSTDDFAKIPGSPIAYWGSKSVRELFEYFPQVSTQTETREGLTTGSNDTFLRLWHEVSQSEVGLRLPNTEASIKSQKRWFPYVKGGDFRRWAGNYEYVVNWFDDGAELKVFADPDTGRIRSHNYNGEYGFRRGFSWSGMSSGSFSVRHVPSGFMFDAKGPMGFPFNDASHDFLTSFLNCKVADHLLRMLAPTMDFKLGHVLNLPASNAAAGLQKVNSGHLVQAANKDWDAFETSWDFSTLPLLDPSNRQASLAATYAALRQHWQGMTTQMQALEEENNRIFIDAYGLADELTPEVPLEEITLTCNPAYRYGGKNDVAANETRLRADTMAEFLSYAVGCMFGRYSLDAPGLILANQGEDQADYLARVPNPSFMPDKDNVIPVLDADWFADDITDRFRQFLRVSFGEDTFRENLRFIEDALGKDIRKYFTKDFYGDHVKRYKKRPIYWQFASPKGSFQALIYMHRYRPDTVSVLLNEYLRDYIGKLENERARLEKLADDPTATPGARTKALKDVGAVVKQIEELTAWERDVVYPLAQEKIAIDLDDGVKRNYPLFGTALRQIKGLEAADD
jgi:hypothetical protein